uniref:Uncharacterized protein n=1 Tax=Anguilla anguilla TaxID=7936 RepID=A0A0E9VGK0_ANGAN
MFLEKNKDRIRNSLQRLFLCDVILLYFPSGGSEGTPDGALLFHSAMESCMHFNIN